MKNATRIVALMMALLFIAGAAFTIIAILLG